MLAAYLSSEALSLLKGLLQKDATKRLGYGPSGSAEIKSHPFFRGIDWKKLEERKVGTAGGWGLEGCCELGSAAVWAGVGLRVPAGWGLLPCGTPQASGQAVKGPAD